MYYAITRHAGRWEFVTSGPDPAQVYEDAKNILLGQQVYPEEEEIGLEPETEAQLENLKVVPEEVARVTYHIPWQPVETIAEEEKGR